MALETFPPSLQPFDKTNPMFPPPALLGPTVQTLAVANSSFGGPHTGVTNFVFVDGSVKSVRNSATLETLTRLVTRNDGLVINSDF